MDMNEPILRLSARDWKKLADHYLKKVIMDAAMENEFGLYRGLVQGPITGDTLRRPFFYRITDPKKYMFFKLRWGLGVDNLDKTGLDFL